MNLEQFLNKEIINKDNQRGLVIYFDEKHTVIKYEKEQKTYSTEIAFKNNYLCFLDNTLNILLKEYLLNKEKQQILKQQEAIKNHKIAVERNKKIKFYYMKLYYKNRFLQTLFGSDFIYPPLVDFKKKHKYLLK